jgi:type II secretory pathway component PulK
VALQKSRRTGFHALEGRALSRPQRVLQVPPKKEKGSALIIAIWTVALLSVLVLSFSFDAILEGRIGTYVRHRQRVNYLTQSGVAIAELLLEKQRKVSATSVTTAEDDRWKAPALRIKRGQTAIIDEPLGDGIIHVEIIPEQSRWNINKLCKSAQGAASGTPTAGQPPLGQSDLVWEQIFRTAGVPDEMFEDLVDCWNDWTDVDRTISGRNGAEDEYYKQETDPKTREPRIPYMTRNGPIDTIDELRLVKGFGPAILDGGILNPEEKRPDQQIIVRGIKELFTTYGDGKINVNAAPREVLMTIPDMDDITAGAIIEEREGRGLGVLGVPSRRTTTTSSAASRTATTGASEEEDFSFKSVGDFMSRVPGIPTSIQQYVTVSSSVFRLNIEGRSAGISHRIEAIAELNGDKVRYLRWREDP